MTLTIAPYLPRLLVPATQFFNFHLTIWRDFRQSSFYWRVVNVPLKSAGGLCSVLLVRRREVKSERKIIKFYVLATEINLLFFAISFCSLGIKIMHKIALKHLFGVSYFRAHFPAQEISTFSLKIKLRNLSHKRASPTFWRARLERCMQSGGCRQTKHEKITSGSHIF